MKGERVPVKIFFLYVVDTQMLIEEDRLSLLFQIMLPVGSEWRIPRQLDAGFFDTTCKLVGVIPEPRNLIVPNLGYYCSLCAGALGMGICRMCKRRFRHGAAFPNPELPLLPMVVVAELGRYGHRFEDN